MQLSKNNAKETWKTINQIIRKPTHHTTFTKIKCTDTNIDLYDPKYISSCFNKYFSSVGSNLAHALPKASFSNSTNSIPSICSSMYIKPVYIEDIINEINQLDTNKCDDTYDIPVKLIKLSKVIIAPILCDLINNCINKGIFPSILKIAKVIPIYKSGEKDLVSNYRPISILPHFSKIFEKILKENIVNFLNKHNVLSESQFGFQQKKSTNEALIELENYLKYQQANNQITCGIFLDLKKAFDTVDHNILKKKLKIKGIRGLSYDLISSYLANRYQFTCVNSQKSNKNIINYGVPQGSILGPILFLLYINDLPKSSNLKTLLFADDTALFASSNNYVSLEKIINVEVKKIENWLLENKLSLNLKKSYTIIFGEKRKKNKPISIFINNTKISNQDTVKYLGVTIDKHLKWKPHIDELTSNVSKSVSILYYLQKYLSIANLKLVYHALVKSKLHYGILLLGNAYKTTLSNLNKIHNRALRYITKLPYRTNIDKLFANANLLKINELYKFTASKYIFKLLYVQQWPKK